MNNPITKDYHIVADGLWANRKTSEDGEILEEVVGVDWTSDLGFGTLQIIIPQHDRFDESILDKLFYDTECMDNDFCRSVMYALADRLFPKNEVRKKDCNEDA